LSGVDIVNDGEFGKTMRASVDYGAWWSYIYERMEGYRTMSASTLAELLGHARFSCGWSQAGRSALSCCGSVN